MARKAIINKDIILGMLKEGQTTRYIAEKFNVTRQAIDLYRKDFIEKGLLPNKRATRASKAPNDTISQKERVTTPKQSLPLKDQRTLDEQIDLIINAFYALKRLPQLEKEVERYRFAYENAIQEINRLKENEKKRLEQENRWFTLQNQNNTNT